MAFDSDPSVLVTVGVQTRLTCRRSLYDFLS